MLLTIKEVSQELKCNTNYVYRLINAGLLPYLQLGGKKVRRESLAEFLKKYDGQDVDEILREREGQSEKVS